MFNRDVFCCTSTPSARLLPRVRQCYSDAVTKNEIIAAVAERHHLVRSDAEVIVHELFAALTEALTRGDRVELRGFGMFTVKDRPARAGHGVAILMLHAPKTPYPLLQCHKK